MKQLLTVLSLVFASVSARAAVVRYEIANGVEWAYTITDGEATIGPDSMKPAVSVETSGSLRVPSRIGGCPVVALSRWCFYKCPNLTSVEIPDGVRSLGYLCFGDCTSLKSVRLPAGLAATPDSLFKGCTALADVEIPQSVMSFGRDCFWGCSSLTNAVLPKGITVLPVMTFYNCVNLKTVELPPNLTELGVSSFSWCTSLRAIDIPDTVSVIGSGAFEMCGALRELRLPSALKRIEGIVGRCTGLTSMTIPKGVTAIADAAFSGCSALVRFDVEDGNEVFKAPDGVLCEGDKLIAWPAKKTPYVVPSGIREVGKGVFQNIRTMTELVLPEGLEVIGPYMAFDTGLTSIKLPSTLKRIEECAFRWCQLKSVEIPAATEYIGRSAFSVCYGLSSVTIAGPSVTIASTAFDGDSALSSFVVLGGVKSVASDAFSGCSRLARPIVSNGTFLGGLADGQTLAVPKGVTSIPEGALVSSVAKHVLLPATLRDISANAFRGCRALVDVYATPEVAAIVSALGIRVGPLAEPLLVLTVPYDLSARREGPFSGIATWLFDEHPETAHGWYEISDFGLVGEEIDSVCWCENDDPHEEGGHLEFDTLKGVRFPFEADLRTHDVTLSCRMKFDAMEECPPVDEPRLQEAEGRRFIRVIGCKVGVRDRFMLFAVIDDPDYVTEVRLGVLSDRVYLTDTRLPYRYENYILDVDWCDLEARMDEDGVTFFCNGDPVCDNDRRKFPYASAASGTKLDGVSVDGHGSIDDVEIGSIQMRALLDVPEKMDWGPSPSVPRVNVYDPLMGLLHENVDYVLSVSDNTMPGTALVTVTGIGSYTGTLEKTFEIVRGRCEIPEVLVGLCGWQGSRANPFVYDGKAGDVCFFVSDAVTETEISISGTTNAVNAGNYRATAKGRLLRVVPGEYRDTVYVTEVNSQFDWAILPKPINSDGIVLEAGATNLWATGDYISAPRPTSVYDRDLGRKLAYVSEYTIAGTASQKDPGTYTVVVLGTGNYSGSLRYAWRIVDPAASTEVGGVSVPNAWLREKGIPIAGGVEAALSSQTGKATASGHPLSVWEEYVQGTDPNDPDDRFEANVTIVDGKPVVTYTPDLGEERTYKVLGSVDLKTWKPAEDGDGSRYFKVQVELK